MTVRFTFNLLVIYFSICGHGFFLIFCDLSFPSEIHCALNEIIDFFESLTKLEVGHKGV